MKIGGRYWSLGHWVLEFDILLVIGNWKFDILSGVLVVNIKTLLQTHDS